MFWSKWVTLKELTFGDEMKEIYNCKICERRISAAGRYAGKTLCGTHERLLREEKE